MENKYYTPEIEEFHVGFECEWKMQKEEFNTYPGNDWIYEWSIHKITIDDFSDHDLADDFHNLTYNLNEWRVKYLDEQDILDLGFKYTNNIRDLAKDNIRIRAYIGEQFEIPAICIYRDENTIFSGKIKNKNELQKLLKQLSVID